MIELKNIQISYNKKECIKSGCFKAYSHQLTGIYGESGTGKSSLLYLIAMLSDQICEYYYNNCLIKYNSEEGETFRKEKIGFITQDSILIDTMTVEKNIEFYLMHGNSSYNVNELLEKIHMSDKKNAMPMSLSGGERQRVAIACAIAKNCEIILADEPTSSLDDDNKTIIYDIFREYANSGKIVILVSHDKMIIDKCDTVYKIEHCQLTKEKSKESIEKVMESKVNKINALKLFEYINYSPTKIKLYRFIVSFLVLSILFLASKVYTKYDLLKDVVRRPYNDVNISDKKLFVHNDAEGIYDLDSISNVLVQSLGNGISFSDEIRNSIDEVPHIKSTYEYYSFIESVGADGHLNNINIIVKNKGKVVEKKELSYEMQDKGYSYDIAIVPYFIEEGYYETNKIYIDEKMAYVYGAQVGDIIEGDFPVPFMKTRQLLSEENSKSNKTYHVEGYITEMVHCELEVAGIVKSNSTLYNECRILMDYNMMKSMIDYQIKRYKGGDLIIDEEAFTEFSEIIELNPSSIIVFTDDYKNVLNVKKNIENISKDIVVGYEYQDVKRINDEIYSNQFYTHMITYLTIAIFVIGAIILEIYYLRKYKSSIMILKLNGYTKRNINQMLLMHFIYQFMIMLCMVFVVYIIGSIPDIIELFMDKNNFSQFYQAVSTSFYFYIYVNLRFTLQHFKTFLLLALFVIIIAHIIIIRYWQNKDIIKWIRGK